MPPRSTPSPPDEPPILGYAPSAGKPRTLLAILALLCGVISVPGFIFFPGFHVPISLLAIVLGALAFIAAHRDPRRHGGKGLALTAIALGMLSLVAFVVVITSDDKL